MNLSITEDNDESVKQIDPGIQFFLLSLSRPVDSVEYILVELIAFDSR